MDLNNARNGIYTTTNSYTVIHTANRPDTSYDRGELIVFSVHNGYGAFQFAAQSIGGGGVFRKRNYLGMQGWSSWTNFF